MAENEISYKEDYENHQCFSHTYQFCFN